MFQTLYYPVFEFKKLPPVLCLSLGGLLGLLLTFFVVSERASGQTEQLVNEYGNSLASVTAGRAVDVAAGRDLVALHALLQELAGQPRVVFAAVYDEAGQLMVQTGEPHWPGKQRQFSAAIEVPGGSAGNVVVRTRVDFSGDSAVSWTLFGTAALLMFMIVLALYESHGSAWRWRKVSLRQSASKVELNEAGERGGDTAASSEQADFVTDDQDGPEPAPASFLLLHALNGSRLRQQLSGDLYERVVEDFFAVLKQVLSLYGGSVEGGQIDSEQGLCIRFYSDGGVTGAVFQSLCAAHLIHELVSNNRFHLKLCVLAAASESAPLPGLVGTYCERTVDDPLLGERLVMAPFNDHLWVVSAFREPFADLVEHQVERLRGAELADG